MKKTILFILSFFIVHTFLGQNNSTTKKDTILYVQISGVVVTGGKLKPVPFVNIVEKKSRRGTTSDYYGFFSFVAVPGDTIIFSSIGYKRSKYIIPSDLKGQKYSLIHSVEGDTVLLAQHDVYPWPSREQFADAFINTNIPNDDLVRAQNNLNEDVLAYKQDAYPSGGGVNFKWQMNKVKSRLYYAGQIPPNNLLNPLAWGKFIKAWKNGDFKRK